MPVSALLNLKSKRRLVPRALASDLLLRQRFLQCPFGFPTPPQLHPNSTWSHPEISRLKNLQHFVNCQAQQPMAASFMSRIGLIRSPKIDYSRLQKPQKAWPAYEDAPPQGTSMNSPDLDDSENEPAQFPRHQNSNGLRGGLFILIGMVIGLLAGSAGVWVLKRTNVSCIRSKGVRTSE